MKIRDNWDIMVVCLVMVACLFSVHFLFAPGPKVIYILGKNRKVVEGLKDDLIKIKELEGSVKSCQYKYKRLKDNMRNGNWLLK